MYLGLVKNKYVIPNEYQSSIYDIDFQNLYNRNFRLILADLDNTLLSYKDNEVNQKLLNFINDLKKMGFEIIIVSNNHSKKRVFGVADKLEIKALTLAAKPLKRGYKKALKIASKKYQKEEVIAIGDQLMTDVFSANRMHFYAILVKAIDKKTEVFTTKINRKIEKHAFKVLKKKGLYNETLEKYEKENYEG